MATFKWVEKVTTVSRILGRQPWNMSSHVLLSTLQPVMASAALERFSFRKIHTVSIHDTMAIPWLPRWKFI